MPTLLSVESVKVGGAKVVELGPGRFVYVSFAFLSTRLVRNRAPKRKPVRNSFRGWRWCGFGLGFDLGCVGICLPRLGFSVSVKLYSRRIGEMETR